MENLTDIPAALRAIDTFMMDCAAKLSDATKAAVLDATSSVSPVDKIVKFGQALYGDLANIPAEAKAIAAQVIAFAAAQGWHGLHTDGAGITMIAELNGTAAPAPKVNTPPLPAPVK